MTNGLALPHEQPELETAPLQFVHRGGQRLLNPSKHRFLRVRGSNALDALRPERCNAPRDSPRRLQLDVTRSAPRTNQPRSTAVAHRLLSHVLAGACPSITFRAQTVLLAPDGL
jgi:hypothetical protein